MGQDTSSSSQYAGTGQTPQNVLDIEAAIDAAEASEVAAAASAAAAAQSALDAANTNLRAFAAQIDVIIPGGGGDLDLLSDSNFGFTIDRFTDCLTDVGGSTVNLTVKINGTPVTGLAPISVTDTKSADVPATGAKTVVDGDAIVLTFAGAAGGPVRFRGVMHGTKSLDN